MSRALLAALDRLCEVHDLAARDRSLRPAQRAFLGALRRYWTDQRDGFTERLAQYRGRFAESVGEPEWGPEWEWAARAAHAALVGATTELYGRALLDGFAQTGEEVGISLGFDLAHPRAVRYLGDRGAQLVTGLDVVTRARLRDLLQKAAEEGWSWQQASREIRHTFDGFWRRVPQEHLRTRADLVAVTELGDAFESGAAMFRAELRGVGIATEKSWITVGDAHVDADCADNEAAGWIPDADAFPAGAFHPPQHPACRCTVATRIMEES